MAFVMQRVGYEISLQCTCLEFFVLLSRNRNVSVVTVLLLTTDSTAAEECIKPSTFGTGLSIPC
jgi:hypothetical protein